MRFELIGGLSGVALCDRSFMQCQGAHLEAQDRPQPSGRCGEPVSGVGRSRHLNIVSKSSKHDVETRFRSAVISFAYPVPLKSVLCV